MDGRFSGTGGTATPPLHHGGIGHGPCGGQVLVKNIMPTLTMQTPANANMVIKQDFQAFFIVQALPAENPSMDGYIIHYAKNCPAVCGGGWERGLAVETGKAESQKHA